MPNEHYKAYSFRLNEKTIEKIKDFKKRTGLSYNLLFLKMLKKIEPYIPTIIEKTPDRESKSPDV